MSIGSARVGLHGIVIPGYISKTTSQQTTQPMMANGLHVRGVVRATRVFDSASVLNDASASPVAIYCDVAAYWSARGIKPQMIHNCLVVQPRSGLHDGDIWVPRATTLDVTGQNHTDPDNSDIMNWDGDHVIVTFLDDNLALPVVIGAIPHPQADRGKSSVAQLGDRMRLREDDGLPRIVKHHGVLAGIDKDGNVSLDTTRAHKGNRNSDGSEPAPTENGDSGRVTITVQSGAELVINGPNGQTVLIQSDGSVEIGRDEGKVVVAADGTVQLGEEAAMKRGIARLNDTTTSGLATGEDPVYWAWVTAVDSFVRPLAAAAMVTLPPAPTALASRINSASSAAVTE